MTSSEATSTFKLKPIPTQLNKNQGGTITRARRVTGDVAAMFPILLSLHGYMCVKECERESEREKERKKETERTSGGGFSLTHNKTCMKADAAL